MLNIGSSKNSSIHVANSTDVLLKLTGTVSKMETQRTPSLGPPHRTKTMLILNGISHRLG